VEKMGLTFFKGKRVFVTGHTGFKGSWLCRVLLKAGADVTGYALEPPTVPSLWKLLSMEKDMRSVIGDVRDFDAMKNAFDEAKPELVLHLAAQPIVLDGYRDPLGTYNTNVMGTINLLECIRLSSAVRSFLNITTDKVYYNNEWPWGYRENDKLDGYDPYSNSKSCSELVTAAYNRSFFAKGNITVSTARAGNVIGGGDFANNRIIPDCVRAAEKNETIILRNPYSIRPYQHVLEALGAYLLIVQKQYGNTELSDSYNVGPEDSDCVTTGYLTDLFCAAWGNNAGWENKSETGAHHEAGFLKLDCSKIKARLGWQPVWNISKAVVKVAEWEKARIYGGNIEDIMDGQINEYFCKDEIAYDNR
jgi:CDP-glucose 4,6-dehydratase